MNDPIRESPPAPTTCARCGRPMTCAPEGACWCMDLPPRLPVPAAPAGCFCPECLEALARPAS